jgi:hypothetical protein
MTDLELLAAEMELGERERLARATELLRLRRLEAACRRHRRGLPHQVRRALEAPAVVTELDPPPAGAPDLFHL